jgi:RNA polymerase sigma factor (sigma-70 family)
MLRNEGRQKIVAWVAREVMPHEPKVRAWLARSKMSKDDIDDVIQETYCRIAAVENIQAIDRPDAYFFSIARNLLTAQMRRNRVVRIDLVAEIESISPFDEAPSPERETSSRIELARVKRLMEKLPDRCRRIFEMRKIEGLSQREIARHMGVTESTVENDSVKGIRLILAALRQEEEAAIDRLEDQASQGALL